MNKILTFLLFFTTWVYATTEVVVTYPWIGDLVKRVGKDHVNVTVLARGDMDPHMIIPRPSMIAKLRNADLLIANGAELEIGWLPPLVENSANANILNGAKGYLELSKSMKIIGMHYDITRAMGDVHPEGNPHFHLDPANIILATQVITAKLSQLNPPYKTIYENNAKIFLVQWQTFMAQWDKKMISIKGKRLIDYHELFDYLFARYKLTTIGHIGPLPGVPPTSRHTAELLNLIAKSSPAFIVQDIYHDPKASKFIAEKSGLKLVILPHDIGSIKEATDIITLFDSIITRLSE